MFPPERISRFLSFLLRHRPADYPLRFDARGYVAWDELMAVLQERFPEISAEEVRGIIEGSDKKRFELKAERVRATYGHSFPVDFGLESVEPPALLYHGAARDLGRTILREGLKPRGRQYVHLSTSPEEAFAVGARGDPTPMILVVDVPAARAGGVLFYASGPLFLAREVPAQFLSPLDK